jgi:hypothetical protein
VDHVDEFVQRGVTVITGLFTAAELDRMRTAMDVLMAKVRQVLGDFRARYTTEAAQISVGGVGELPAAETLACAPGVADGSPAGRRGRW